MSSSFIFKGSLLFWVCFSVDLLAKAPLLTPNQLESPPPKIIRTCCSFGFDLGIFGLPGKKFSDITQLDRIGPHIYLGSKEEGNGIIYTEKGGFVDLGHVRDQADWTAYIYKLILKNKAAGSLEKLLGYEGGEKILNIKLPENISDKDLITLAGRVAYDLSVWHEIATWFGVSYIPFLPERYSSFSIEDNYSNLLGVQIGIKALASDLPYEEAMTQLIFEYLENLKAVATEEETLLAMEEVENIWWTRERKLPSEKVLLERDLDVYYSLRPWLVPGWAEGFPSILQVPERTSDGQLLSSIYQLSFELNYKFPFKKMFPNRAERRITQEDFDILIYQVAYEWMDETYKKDIYTKSIRREIKRQNNIPDLEPDNEV